LTFILSGVFFVNKPSYSRSLLFGRWYRNEINVKGEETLEYAQFSSDGSFEFTFITLDNKGEVVEQIIELGDWGLVAGIHFTLTKDEVINEQLYTADLNNDDNYHAYHVKTLDHKTFCYQHAVTNEEYIMRRVVDSAGHC
jgi:hypothetical protein